MSPDLGLLFLGRIGTAVRYNLTVPDLYYSRGILICKVGVVRYHYYKTLARNLLDEVHYLHGSLCVQRARGLVREQNFGVVDERTRNCNPLHLSARKLIGTL